MSEAWVQLRADDQKIWDDVRTFLKQQKNNNSCEATTFVKQSHIQKKNSEERKKKCIKEISEIESMKYNLDIEISDE